MPEGFPVPETEHRRIIVVGDVHGCIDELDELLRVVEFEQGKDRLVFVGDLLDRGPDPVGVVRRARELGAESVMGNHEEKHLRFAQWEAKVREGTAEKNLMRPFDEKRLAEHHALNEDDWAWIRAMPKLIRLPRGGRRQWVVVHAGFESDGMPIDDQKFGTVCRLRDVGPDGKQLKNKEDFFKPHPDSVPWAEKWVEKEGETDHECVIYGHVVHSLEKFRITGLSCYGIDTGCVFGGRLTAWVRTQNPGLWRIKCAQVQAREQYYPIPEGAEYGLV